MAVNDLSKFLVAPSERVVPFTYEGVQFEARGVPGGDRYFAIIFPDQDEARKACIHHAAVNKRAGGPYPVEIYGDILAIGWAFKDPEGEPLDPSVAFALYDANPALFSLLRAAALDVWGVDETNRNSGYVAWNTLYGVLTAAKAEAAKEEVNSGAAYDVLNRAVNTAFEISYRAMQDYRADVGASEPQAELDGAMETLERGNP